MTESDTTPATKKAERPRGPIRSAYKRWRHSVGLKTWATKSYEVWLALQTSLFLVRPRMLVELGSGRSTNYLGEYAFKMGARLVSIEEHAHYAKKANRLLRDSFLPDDFVHHVPVHDGWYDPERVVALLQPLEEPIDFILVDGPSSAGLGDRGSRAFARYVEPLLGSVKLAVIDDTHRPECNEVATHLAETHGLTRHDMSYLDVNEIAFLSSPEADKRLEPMPGFLKALMRPR